MNRNEKTFALLKEQGKRKADMARALGISKSAVTQWEKKGVEPTYEQCVILSDFFNVPIGDFFIGWDDNLANSGDLIAKIMMDTELLGYVEKLYLLSPDKRAKVYGYIDAV